MTKKKLDPRAQLMQDAGVTKKGEAFAWSVWLHMDSIFVHPDAGDLQAASDLVCRLAKYKAAEIGNAQIAAQAKASAGARRAQRKAGKGRTGPTAEDRAGASRFLKEVKKLEGKAKGGSR